MTRIQFVSIAVLSVALAGGIAPAQAEVTEEFHRTYSLPSGAPVRVSNSSGKVEITAWDQPYADVRAVKHTRRDRGDLERVSIVVQGGNALEIRTVYDCTREKSRRDGGFLSFLFGGIDTGSRPWVDYTIRIPQTARLERVETSSGDIEVRNAGGDAALHASSGDITAAGVSGALEIRSSSGDITAERCSLRSVQSSSGSVRLRDVQGDFTLKTSSGDVEITGAGGRIDAHSSSGDIRIQPAGLADSVRLSSNSGDITVDLPDSINASLVMETNSGDLVNRSAHSFATTTITRRRIAGTLGAGGAPLTVRTSSGDVVLK